MVLSAMGEVIDMVSKPVKAAGWYGHTKGFHTISIKTLNLQGTVYIEGTLAISPTEQDWFPIILNGLDRLIFPRAVAALDVNWTGPGWSGETTTLGFNFVCNCLFLRARVIRSDIIPPWSTPDYITNYGKVDSILLNF